MPKSKQQQSSIDEGAELATLINAKGNVAVAAESDINAQGSFSVRGREGGGGGGSGGMYSESASGSTNESKEITNDNSHPPEPSPLIKAAQAGDLETVKNLIEQGQATGQDISEDGTTALHWAAINNRLSICKYLLEHGDAVVDAKGGELQATPLHWACRNGLVYIVHLLINHGADPLRTDSQGFNGLHLATHSSNVLLVIYLLHYGLQVDLTDPNGRTSLHWAAYQGDALTVDALLKWGSDVKIKDTMGFTALHWAVVKGSKACMQRLIEEGSDVFATSNEGKSPRVMAEEMNSVGAFEGALVESGRLKTGALRPRYLSEKVTKFISQLSPTAVFPVVFGLIAILPWYFSLPLNCIIYYGYLKILNSFVFPNAYFGHGALLRSPFLSGVFLGSCVWTWVIYLFYVLPATFFIPGGVASLLNILFGIIFAVCMYAFYQTMYMDPGFVPKLSGISEQKRVIEELIERGEFDSRHFCIATYIRKPLRSKYDRFSKRVVARFDHYCPWVNNVIGVRNHRMFVVYVLSLWVGLSLWVWLYFGYYPQTLINGMDRDIPSCSVYPDALCISLEYAPFATTVVLWDSLQLIWIVFLVFVQLVQIARSMTTNEATNLHKFGFLGADDFSSLPQDHHSNMATSDQNAKSRTSGGLGGGLNSRCWSTAFRVLGIDQFVSTAQDTFGRSRGGDRLRPWKETNPADYGVFRNCQDFWFPGHRFNVLQLPNQGEGSLGGHTVDYYRLWEFPKLRVANGYEQV